MEKSLDIMNAFVDLFLKILHHTNSSNASFTNIDRNNGSSNYLHCEKLFEALRMIASKILQDQIVLLHMA